MNFAISIGEIKEVTMTWIYSLNHRQEMKKEFWWGYFLESIHLENNKGDGRITLMDLREIGCEDKKWMELAQIHVQWKDFAILNLWVQFPEC
jgi:hypothetical protein